MRAEGEGRKAKGREAKGKVKRNKATFLFASRLPIFAFLILVSCSNGNVKLDNPTAEKVTFNIDGESHDVPAKGTEGISLSAGKHHVKVGGKEADFEVKDGGVLHTGTTNYVAFRLGRKSIGIDLSEDYLTLAEDRCRLLF